MATNVKLSATKRTGGGKGDARKARAAGLVPAVVYGRGEETRAIMVDAHELERLFSRVHYENTLIELDIEGEGQVRVLVREVQSHAFRNEVLHVDFYQIHANEKITVDVPIRLHGNPPGVKAGGILQHVLTNLELSCLPGEIPEQIDLDVSELEIGSSVHVRELPLPKGVESQVDGERVVVTLSPPMVSTEAAAEGEAAAPEAAPSEPEVIKRGREDGEG